MKKHGVLFLVIFVLAMVPACGGGGGADDDTITVPAAPSGLSGSATASDTVELSWFDHSGNESGFYIYKLPDTVTPAKSVGVGVTSTIITGLLAERDYDFEVTAYNSAGESTASNTAPVTTPSPPVPAPAAPSGLDVSAVSTSEALLTWVDNSDDEERFRVYRGTTSVTITSLMGSVSADSTRFVDNTLTSGQTYYYNVRAHNAGGESAPTDVDNIMTYSPEGRWEYELVAFTNCAPYGPRTYGFLGWGALTETSPRQLSFNTDQGDLNGYYVPQEESFQVGLFGFLDNIGMSPLTLWAPSDWSDMHSASGSIQVSGCGGPVTSGFFTRIDPGAPEAPTGLTATALSSSIIELTWTDSAQSELEYFVYRGTYLFGIDTLVATLPPGTESYRNEGLPANTSYVYQVVASNTFGDSPRSNIDGAGTLPAPTNPPDAPSVLLATLSSDTTASLTWQHSGEDEEGFRVYRGTSSGSIGTLVGTTGINETLFEDTSLGEGVTYYYQVAAYNGAGESVRSNYDSVFTPSNTPVPDAPSNLTTAVLSGTEIQLDWSDNSADETGFTIYRRIGSCSGTFFGLYSAPVGATSKVISNLESNTTYCFKISAYNGAGESGFSNTASATTEYQPATLRVVNNTHYDMIDVRIDGNQQFAYPMRILPEGGWQEWEGAAGTYLLQVGVGFYDTDESRDLWFNFEGSAALTEGQTATITIENPTVGQLLAGSWEGTWYCGLQFNTMGYTINNNNSYIYYVNDNIQHSGSITNVNWETYDTAINFNMNGPVTLFYPFGVISKQENLNPAWNCGVPTYWVEYTRY